MAKSHQSKPANEAVEQAMKNGNAAMKNGMENMTKAYERFTGFGKENVEAYMQSATAFAKAFERINGEVFSFSKQQVEDGVAAFKAVTGSKSLHEAWEVQSDFAKSALDAYVAHATKVNDLVMDAAKQAGEPLTARFTALADVAKDVRPVYPFGKAAE
jgi:phasin family protein